MSHERNNARAEVWGDIEAFVLRHPEGRFVARADGARHRPHRGSWHDEATREEAIRLLKQCLFRLAGSADVEVDPGCDFRARQVIVWPRPTALFGEEPLSAEGAAVGAPGIVAYVVGEGDAGELEDDKDEDDKEEDDQGEAEEGPSADAILTYGACEVCLEHVLELLAEAGRRLSPSQIKDEFALRGVRHPSLTVERTIEDACRRGLLALGAGRRGVGLGLPRWSTE